MTSQPQNEITILGAGLAGSLMTILLARRGVPVHLIERRPDLRTYQQHAGRSINLALADRGLHALKAAGVHDAVKSLLIPMSGRMLHHIDGSTQFVPYGQREHEVIYSVSRNGLTQLLLDHAARFPQVSMIFETECTSIDFNHQHIGISHHDMRDTHTYRHLIAADGYHSAVRAQLVAQHAVSVKNELLPHGYKELTIPAGTDGRHQLHAHALHIWPRGGFMLIALPNLDGSFTATLFLPFDSNDTALPCFAQLRNAEDVNGLMGRYFPDAKALMPGVADEFFSHPVGRMHTIHASRWSDGRNAVLIGDAAHAIVPFHGQGMNCAFEDCIKLDALLQSHPFAEAVAQFTQHRKPDTDAIAGMALENYVEMRDTVRHPKFLLQKELSFELERRFPEQFIPRYSMVMFHHDIPYAAAYERGKIQAQILDELTDHATALSEVNMQLAAIRINALLPPLTTSTPSR